MDYIHIPVMVKEVCEVLDVGEGGLFVDCTLGLGGHSEAILKASSKSNILGIDRDLEAIEIAKNRLKKFGDRVTILNCNFKEIDLWKSHLNEEPKGILLDLGLSSLQLQEGRGFSFKDEKSLDMRMDSSKGFSASQFLKNAKEKELSEILKEYGEVKNSNRIAKAIKSAVKEERIKSAKDLSKVVEEVVSSKRDSKHPATKVFQAIRIFVNEELKDLDKFIKDAFKLLKESGRMAVISYHSLEDRIVKNAFRELKKGCTCPPQFPLCVCGKKSILSFASKTPLRPNMNEVLANPSSRSARLRYAIRK